MKFSCLCLGFKHKKNAHLPDRDERFFDSLKSFGSPAAHESGSVALRHQVSLVLPLSKTSSYKIAGYVPNFRSGMRNKKFTQITCGNCWIKNRSPDVMIFLLSFVNRLTQPISVVFLSQLVCCLAGQIF